jgi:hypothetical protein
MKFRIQHSSLITHKSSLCINPELRTWNPEPGTRNLEPGTWNPEPGTRNLVPLPILPPAWYSLILLSGSLRCAAFLRLTTLTGLQQSQRMMQYPQ